MWPLVKNNWYGVMDWEVIPRCHGRTRNPRIHLFRNGRVDQKLYLLGRGQNCFAYKVSDLLEDFCITVLGREFTVHWSKYAHGRGKPGWRLQPADADYFRSGKCVFNGKLVGAAMDLKLHLKTEFEYARKFEQEAIAGRKQRKAARGKYEEFWGAGILTGVKGA